jgi:outer membrane protein OmpA-like peptidoglycan-associated protein
VNYRCAATPTRGAGTGDGASPGGTGGVPPAGVAAIERALASAGKVDIYSIFFSFNSDVIRDESEPTLKDIAEVLRRRPDWHLAVNGHTDGIGGDQFNLDLSKRRAAAVKDALVKRYGIEPQRLVTSGFGKSQPKDTNDTLEGRAHNRRVELAKIG